MSASHDNLNKNSLQAAKSEKKTVSSQYNIKKTEFASTLCRFHHFVHDMVFFF